MSLWVGVVGGSFLGIADDLRHGLGGLCMRLGSACGFLHTSATWGGLSGEMEVAGTSVVGRDVGSGSLGCYISGT